MRDGCESEIRVYGLGISRVEAVAAAEATASTFAPLAAGPERPHIVGRSADGGCRVELIGPEARVFKAVLMADLEGDVPVAAAWFLGAFVPDWRDAPAWLAAGLPDVARGGGAEARLARLHVQLRRMGHLPTAILSLSWVPGKPNGIACAVERRPSAPTPTTRARRAARP